MGVGDFRFWGDCVWFWVEGDSCFRDGGDTVQGDCVGGDFDYRRSQHFDIAHDRWEQGGRGCS